MTISSMLFHHRKTAGHGGTKRKGLIAGVGAMATGSCWVYGMEEGFQFVFASCGAEDVTESFVSSLPHWFKLNHQFLCLVAPPTL